MIKKPLSGWRHLVSTGRDPDKSHQADAMGPPCPIAIAQMHHRNGLEPASSTAAICGDPKPGYSALDRWIQEQADKHNGRWVKPLYCAPAREMDDAA